MTTLASRPRIVPSAARAVRRLKVIGWPGVAVDVVMHQRRVGSERVDGGENGGQILVFDLDKLSGKLGGRLVLGGDRGDWLADEADTIDGEDALVLDDLAKHARAAFA